jgi:hypothetical protein
MNAETDAYFGRDTPSRTYKWGLALPTLIGPHIPPQRWQVVAWFPTQTAAEQYAARVHGGKPYAIARGWNL